MDSSDNTRIGDMKPRLLLMEDDEKLRKAYMKSLKRAGFYVVAIDDGRFLENHLVAAKGKGELFSVVLSDTDMPDMPGDISCMRAINRELIDLGKTLILGMSEDSHMQGYWRGIANHCGFFEKSRYSPLGDNDIGEAVMRHYMNFSHPEASPIWRARMPGLSEN